ncbi:MAG: hypothetical protein AB7G44_03450 [Bacteroidia bacterium]
MKKTLYIFIVFLAVSCSSEFNNHTTITNYCIDHYPSTVEYKTLGWGKVIDLGNETVSIRHQYKIKNNFGQYVTMEKTFHVKNDEVIKVVD